MRKRSAKEVLWLQRCGSVAFFTVHSYITVMASPGSADLDSYRRVWNGLRWARIKDWNHELALGLQSNKGKMGIQENSFLMLEERVTSSEPKGLIQHWMQLGKTFSLLTLISKLINPFQHFIFFRIPRTPFSLTCLRSLRVSFRPDVWYWVIGMKLGLFHHEFWQGGEFAGWT